MTRTKAAARMTHCPAADTPDPSLELKPVPKNATTACLREVASRQPVATTIQQDYVPSEAGCETSPQHPNTTQLSVTAYKGVIQLSMQKYNEKEAYLVARIDNFSDCSTSGLVLAAGHSYFFVVEAKGTKARLVDVTGGADIRLKFSSCTAAGFPPPPTETPKNVAFLRSQRKQCNHDPDPEGQITAIFSYKADSYLAESKSRSAKVMVDSPFAVWISCGTDCCFADL